MNFIPDRFEPITLTSREVLETVRQAELRFLQACQEGEIDIIDQLINKVDINCRDEEGQTGLLLACVDAAWAVDVITRLIQHGIDVDIKDDYDISPMDRILSMSPFKADIATMVLNASFTPANKKQRREDWLQECRTVESIKFLTHNGINIDHVPEKDTFLDLVYGRAWRKLL
jgi:ankyrin repeat protein